MARLCLVMFLPVSRGAEREVELEVITGGFWEVNRDRDLQTEILWGVLLESAPAGREEGRIGQKGKLNNDVLKQRPQLNLQELWGWGHSSNLTRIGE